MVAVCQTLTNDTALRNRARTNMCRRRRRRRRRVYTLVYGTALRLHGDQLVGRPMRLGTVL